MQYVPVNLSDADLRLLLHALALIPQKPGVIALRDRLAEGARRRAR